jgi:hypothetical protein
MNCNVQKFDEGELQITSPNPWCLQVCKAMFFFVNFVISQSGNDPREDLAKFGY